MKDALLLCRGEEGVEGEAVERLPAAADVVELLLLPVAAQGPLQLLPGLQGVHVDAALCN